MIWLSTWGDSTRMARDLREGACEKAGSFHSAPYAADYVFLRKG